jgi:hypothetical protein
MNAIVKYSVLFLFVVAANSSFAGNTEEITEDKYSFKFIDSKVYTGKTDIWAFQLYKNAEPLKVMNVYVSTGFDGSRILVDFDFNTSWNMYYLSNKRPVDNFQDSYRLKEYTANSLNEAVEMAVDHYIQDQIIKGISIGTKNTSNRFQSRRNKRLGF